MSDYDSNFTRFTSLRFMVVCILACLLAACTTQKTQQANPSSVYQKVLDNGLKVLVKPDRRAPVVVSQIWYKVGGSYEPAGQTGISHVLEHMMFKGTENLGPNEFSRIIAEHGGRDNAFTGRDYTAYFQTLEKSKLEIALELESDRMRNLLLEPQEFEKEIEVVKEERRSRTDDRPQALAYEQFMSSAYTLANYRNPIVGWPEDLDSMKVEDLRAWYDGFYAPNNATLVVVGDVDPTLAFDLAERYFGSIPRREILATPNPVEPPQEKSRRVQVEAAAKVPYLLLGYHAPVVSSLEQRDGWMPYALEIAAYILDGGKSARLSSRLVQKQIAASISVSYDPFARNPTLFVISGNPAPGTTLQQLETAIREQIYEMQNELVTEQELDRVKTQIIASKVYEADSSFYQGMRLGILETNGLPWQLSEKIHEKLRSITAEQVREAVSRHLLDENMTVALLQPQMEDEG